MFEREQIEPTLIKNLDGVWELKYSIPTIFGSYLKQAGHYTNLADAIQAMMILL